MRKQKSNKLRIIHLLLLAALLLLTAKLIYAQVRGGHGTYRMDGYAIIQKRLEL